MENRQDNVAFLAALSPFFSFSVCKCKQHTDTHLPVLKKEATTLQKEKLNGEPFNSHL